MNIYPRSQIDAAKQQGRNCAIGRIRYSAVDGSTAPDAIIVYIKPACNGDEPRDIYEYFNRSETFPHESTADQFSPSRSSAWRAHDGETLRGWRQRFSQFDQSDLWKPLADRSAEWLKDLIQLSPNASDAAGAV